MTVALFTFIATSALYASLAALALHRVARHVQRNPEGLHAVLEHVLVPMVGRWHVESVKKSDPMKKKPLARETGVD
ncbi:MAG TPA: hypothetical protein VFE62_10280 [Gemmataceae bacterium]|nr:hypothetical protein [Gemmataceae bacterium]